LAAQGFDRCRPTGNPDVRHYRRVIDSLGLLQLDYVNVLMPAQFLVLWSRLGAYDRGRFERFVYDKCEYTEQWAHEASIVPVDSWPLLGYRRTSHELHKNNPLRELRNRSAYLDVVLKQVQRDGALTANDLPPAPGPKRKPGDWHRSMPRRALEYHFARGDLVQCLDPEGNEVARGLVNYNAAESQKIIGQPSSQIEVLLGYVDETELIHRDNLVLTA